MEEVHYYFLPKYIFIYQLPPFNQIYPGAFLVPYIISLVLMGIPVFLFEMGSGQFSSEGPIKIWNICPLFQGELEHINLLITIC